MYSQIIEFSYYILFLTCCIAFNLSQLATQELQNQTNLGCFVPKTTFLSMVDTSTNDTLTSGRYVQSQTSIEYICPKHFFMDGEYITNFCLDDWINPHPLCIKMCPPLKGITINAKCYYKGEEVDCKWYSMPGTTAKIVCAFMYQKPQDRLVYDDLRCLEDGEWDHSLFKCEQICGTVDTKVPLIVNSKLTEVQKVPWQVAIYRKDKDETYEHICGGTLIQSKIVITAAHCFWDTTISRLSNRSDFAIAVGKYYRDYYATNETLSVQKLNIFKIDVPVQFEGADYDFISDIAILTLADHVIFKGHIRPACLTWKTYNDKYIPSNLIGIISGWGITDTGTYSPELRSAQFTSIAGESCKKKITKNDKISGDKFCIETSEGKNVCEGDSGGGFLVPVNINNVTYYHLEGIVSNGIRSKMCDSQFITTFTNIQWYESFVIQSVTNNLLMAPPTTEDIKCFVPIGNYLVLTDIATKNILIPGTNANKSTHVDYTCSEDYILSGKYHTNVCEEEWINPHPKCIKMCPPIVGITISPVCVYKEKTIPCDVPVEPGTTAKIGCAFMYQKPQDRYVNEDLLCEDDGKYNYSPFDCEQVCGTVHTSVPLLVNGVISRIKEVPWVIAIYSNRYPFQNKKYEHICSGTLVKSNVVISAANCFWDKEETRIFDKANFIVAAGKTHRDYYSNEEIEEVQIANISKIIIPDLFGVQIKNYVSNIAVLILNKHIVYKNHIRPACLSSEIYSDNSSFVSKSGVISGWGSTSDFDSYSLVLRSIELSSIDSQNCKSKVENTVKIPKDSFCVEVIDGKNLGRRDSGAGFLVPENIAGVKRYYLLGVVEPTNDFINIVTSIPLYESLILQSDRNESSETPYDVDPFRCYIPENRLFTMYDISTNSSLISGTYAQLLTHVKYFCPAGHFLEGLYSTNLCKNGQWINPHPKCIKVCPPIEDYSIDVLCYYEEKEVSCNEGIIPGTTAKINCKFMYEKPQDRLFYEDLYCKNDGTWDFQLSKCDQICGTIYYETSSDQKENKTEVYKVPWLTGVYSKNEEERYIFLCTGTLISSKIVISAAHCFWNQKEEKIIDKSQFVVSVGKFYSDYYASNETETMQILNISRIDIPIQYEGTDFDFGGDIAIITLDYHIAFKNHIRPACLTWKNFNNKDVPSNLFGIVAGWGAFNSIEFDHKLNLVELKSIDNANCRERRKKMKNVPRDKFCAEMIDEKIICVGVAGSGFVVPWNVNGVTNYHLWGVVSNKYTIKKNHSCGSSNILCQTTVQDFQSTLKKKYSCGSRNVLGLTSVQKYESLIKSNIPYVH